MFMRLHNKMHIIYMETNVIQKLQQDEETALDALGELAQKDSTEATIAEYAMRARKLATTSVLNVPCLIGL